MSPAFAPSAAACSADSALVRSPLARATPASRIEARGAVQVIRLLQRTRVQCRASLRRFLRALGGKPSREAMADRPCANATSTRVWYTKKKFFIRARDRFLTRL